VGVEWWSLQERMASLTRTDSVGNPDDCRRLMMLARQASGERFDRVTRASVLNVRASSS